jgi:hypothetical protein
MASLTIARRWIGSRTVSCRVVHGVLVSAP